MKLRNLVVPGHYVPRTRYVGEAKNLSWSLNVTLGHIRREQNFLANIWQSCPHSTTLLELRLSLSSRGCRRGIRQRVPSWTASRLGSFFYTTRHLHLFPGMTSTRQLAFSTFQTTTSSSFDRNGSYAANLPLSCSCYPCRVVYARLTRRNRCRIDGFGQR